MEVGRHARGPRTGPRARYHRGGRHAVGRGSAGVRENDGGKRRGE